MKFSFGPALWNRIGTVLALLVFLQNAFAQADCGGNFDPSLYEIPRGTDATLQHLDAHLTKSDPDLCLLNGDRNDNRLITSDATSALLPVPPGFLSSKTVGKNVTLAGYGIPEGIMAGQQLKSSPLTSADKLQRFLQHNFSPSSLRGTLLDAAQAQYFNDWPGYGRGPVGFEKRYGALLADRSTKGFFGTFLFPSLFRQDPRPFRLGAEYSWLRRVGYAITRFGITRDDFGRESFNASFVFSTIVSQSLTNLYYPRQQRGFSQTASRIEGSMLDNLQSSLSREFMPDIEHFFWRHAPSKLKHFEQRLPYSKTWQPEGFADAL